MSHEPTAINDKLDEAYEAVRKITALMRSVKYKLDWVYGEIASNDSLALVTTRVGECRGLVKECIKELSE